MAQAEQLVPTVSQLEAAKAILEDSRFYDEKNDEYVIYFRTQAEADKFIDTISGFCSGDLKSIEIH